ncbi:MAG: diaminopimelate decarboxylase [Chloroflexi bacterium]|nr:diaminopimelate decarboxylase [Chloroflexota bacterium]
MLRERAGQMVFNSSIRFVDARLMIDDLPVDAIARELETPVYVYSLKRVRKNYRRVKGAFEPIGARIHYSAKANSNGAILRALIEEGAGIDAVSGGEIARALQAGAAAQDIVFAGVGKTVAEIASAVELGIGWFNVENELELQYINDAAASVGAEKVQVALRFNPEVSANTHPHLATGHGSAKFGLSAGAIGDALEQPERYPCLSICGIHVHIGSQLGDSAATVQAIARTKQLIEPYPEIHTINLGGGLPVAYRHDQTIPTLENLVSEVAPHLHGYQVLLEPGRAIVADAGILVATVLYVKEQAGKIFYVVDASMAELIRPALYGAQHEIIPLVQSDDERVVAQVVGPVCESADVLAQDREMTRLKVGDQVAIMTAGAYGMAMASNYNSRMRPAEVVVAADGDSWSVSRRRESIQDLMRFEN